MKVFGARGFFRPRALAADVPESFRVYAAEQPWANQTREIVAARSRAAAGRAMGLRPHEFEGACLGETGNAEYIEQAMTEPGVVFWHPLDYRGPDWARKES